MILATTSNRSARHATIPPITAPNRTDSPVGELDSVLIADVVSRIINVVLYPTKILAIPSYQIHA